MKNDRIALIAACLLVLPLVPTAGAEPARAALDETRETYLEAKDFLEATPRPLRDDPDFAVKLENWSEMSRRHREAAQTLVAILVPLSTEVPADRFPAVRDELLGLRQDLVAGPTEASHDNLAHFAQVILPVVRDRGLPADRAALLVTLTTPNERVRDYDSRTQNGLPSEPTGLLIQDVHSLAQARAGNFGAARAESDLLLKKIAQLLRGRLPNLGLNHGGTTRTKPSLHREFLLHRALIESLAGDDQAAQDHLAAAKDLEEKDPAILAAQQALLKRLAK